MGSGGLMRSIEGGIRFFFSSNLVRGVHVCSRVEATRRARKTKVTVSPLQSRAWSFAFLARFARRIKRKERLLVV